MAGDWIKMRADLADDPAVFKVRLAIGDDRLQIIGRLHIFWAWADKHAVDGLVDGATSQLVDDIAGKEGFAAAMVAVKWLVVLDKGILLPNSERHNGESAKERTLKNQRQARWRERKAAGLVGDDVDGNASTDASTREEKRRDTLSKDKDASASVPDAIWDTGLSYLVSHGVKESGARSFLGKMRQALNDDLLVAELLTKAQTQQVSDPLAWLRAAAGRKTNTGKTKSGVAL